MEMDPLLKDLSDKNNRLRRNVLSMAMELKNARGMLISKEKSVAREEQRRREAESSALKLKKEVCRLQKNLDEKDWQLWAAEKKLEDIKQMVSHTRENSPEHNEDLSYKICKNTFEKLQKQLVVRDEEMAILMDEIRTIFDHFEIKTVELQSQVRGNHRLEKELKKRVLKLEYFLQETRSQARRLHRNLEKRDRAMKNLKNELEEMKEERKGGGSHGFWQSSGFKVAVSMSMVILVALSRS